MNKNRETDQISGLIFLNKTMSHSLQDTHLKTNGSNYWSVWCGQNDDTIDVNNELLMRTNFISLGRSAPASPRLSWHPIKTCRDHLTMRGDVVIFWHVQGVETGVRHPKICTPCVPRAGSPGYVYVPGAGCPGYILVPRAGSPWYIFVARAVSPTLPSCT